MLRSLWPTSAEPVPSGEGELPDPRVRPAFLLLIWVLAFIVYLMLVPALLRTSSPPTGDQPYYLMDAISLVQDGDLDVANNYARHDEDAFYGLAPRPRGFSAQSAPYPLPPHLIVSPARPPSEWYDYHAPGLGIAIVPAWIVGSWLHLWWPAVVVFLCMVGAAVTVNIFLLAFQAAGDVRIAWVVWAAMSFNAPLMCYAVLVFTEMPVSLLIVYAFRRFSVGWGRNRPWQLALAGICVACIPWVSWRCGLIAAGLGVLGTVRWWRFRRSSGSGAATGALLFFPSLVSGVAIAGYGLFLTGRPLLDLRYRVGGVADAFYWPWKSGADLRLFVSGAMALLFDQQWGLLVHSPVYLLTFVGLLGMLRPDRKDEHRQLVWLVFLSLPYLALICSYQHWGGLWCPPGRYLTPLLPLCALPLALSLRALASGRAYRAVFLLFALFGYYYVVMVSSDMHLMWPARKGFFWAWASRMLPGDIDLRDFLPAFAWPDADRSVKTGWMFGWATALVLFFRFRMLSGRESPRAHRAMRRIAGAAGAACLVALVWLVVNADSIRGPLGDGLRRILGLNQ